jgi:hypothetical protein
MFDLRRREFIILVGGSASTWQMLAIGLSQRQVARGFVSTGGESAALAVKAATSIIPIHASSAAIRSCV